MILRPVDSRRARVVRAGGAAAIATLTASAAHTLGGGIPPAPWLVLTVMLLSWPLALAIVGRRPGSVRTALAVVSAQALLHTAFALVGGAEPHGIWGTHHHGRLILDATAAAGAPPDTGMLSAHVVAAIVTAAMVCHGERMLRATARGIRYLLRLRTPALLSPTPVPTAAGPLPRRPRPRLLLADLSRRGPPR
ncbi:hypothetical protein ACIQLK_13035 [Microbacterium sp. NPDC091382]|uniref:hypothetical protein n=1 Tax=Microbacterium sp. NPDC091382 TaxID=3364210 RepID=UPI003802E0C6